MSPVRTYNTGVYGIHLKLDIYQSLQRVLHGPPIPNVLAPYLGTTKWHSLSTEDPLPFIVDLITALTRR
jgi:hypothetical protein